jgi:histidinol-phosphate/aromatic aminotransferase/cobyric acid decarboxylase-like protein
MSEHGGTGARLAARLGIAPDAVLDLSASLNPLAPDVTALVVEHASAVRRYPDDRDATRALASAVGIDADRVVLTNGGAEAIALVAAELPTGRVDEPEFSLYARHLRHVTDTGPRWRSNPHNPSGRLAPDTELADVWDEAFYPLATGRWTRPDRHPDAIVLGSLTKTFACPGLRLGYVLAPTAELAGRIRARQSEWSVGTVACEVVPELLERADLRGWSTRIKQLRTELETVLHAHGLAPEPSAANFVLVPRAPGLRDHLAAHAVLVRDTGSFGIHGGARIAVPDARGLERLQLALKGYAP